MNFLLSKDDNYETLAEASRDLLREYVDRHVYASLLAIPLIANLQEKECYDWFVEAGEIYIKEN